MEQGRVFSRANAARRADARARHTSAWGVCLSHDSSLHDVREDVVWCESCAITPLAVAMASTTNAKKNANGKIARATTALKARKTTSEKRGRRDARAPNTGRGHRRGNASGKRKSDEKSTTAKRSKTNEMTKEDFEIGMEVSVKGPANAVWCAEIVDVRSRRKAPLEVKWFDSASASASAGEYSYWDCMKNDKVEIKSVFETHKSGHFAPPKGGRLSCTKCKELQTTCARRLFSAYVPNDVEL